MTTPTNDTPRIATDWHHIGNRPHQLNSTQKYRRKHGLSIYERDRQVEPYKVNKGEFV